MRILDRMIIRDFLINLIFSFIFLLFSYLNFSIFLQIYGDILIMKFQSVRL